MTLIGLRISLNSELLCWLRSPGRKILGWSGERDVETADHESSVAYRKVSSYIKTSCFVIDDRSDEKHESLVDFSGRQANGGLDERI